RDQTSDRRTQRRVASLQQGALRAERRGGGRCRRREACRRRRCDRRGVRSEGLSAVQRCSALLSSYETGAAFACNPSWKPSWRAVLAIGSAERPSGDVSTRRFLFAPRGKVSGPLSATHPEASFRSQGPDTFSRTLRKSTHG